jgi:hypothetical protein
MFFQTIELPAYGFGIMQQKLVGQVGYSPFIRLTAELNCS